MADTTIVNVAKPVSTSIMPIIYLIFLKKWKNFKFEKEIRIDNDNWKNKPLDISSSFGYIVVITNPCLPVQLPCRKKTLKKKRIVQSFS